LLPAKGYRLELPVFDITPVDPPMLVAHRIFIGCTVTVISTILIDTPARAMLTTFGCTLTQPPLSPPLGFVLGAFQGEIGALLYGLPIVAGLLTLWFAVYQFLPWKARCPRALASFVGGACGFCGGMMVSLALMFAQSLTTLRAAGWLPENSTNRWEAVTVTRYSYVSPLFGFVVGACVAYAVLYIVRRPQWQIFLINHTSLTNPRIALRVLVALFKTGTVWCLVFVIPEMLAAAMVACEVVSKPVPVGRIIGESMVVAIGGIAFVGGLLTALYSLTKGADIAAEQKCSLAP
jgi:hypothetical protein